MDPVLTRWSKLLSLVLRHRPDEFGVALGPGGWTAVDPLLEALAANGTVMTREDIEAILRSGDKKRFELSEDGQSIRATHGHSVRIEMDYGPTKPPEILYHGTVGEFLSSIRERGLEPGDRRYVHLSSTREDAQEVGSRRGRPVIVEVRAAAMETDGHLFYRTASNVWLTERVPTEFIDIP